MKFIYFSQVCTVQEAVINSSLTIKLNTNYKLGTRNKYAQLTIYWELLLILLRITKVVNSRFMASLKRSALLKNKQPLGSHKTGNLNFPLALQRHITNSFTTKLCLQTFVTCTGLNRCLLYQDQYIISSPQNTIKSNSMSFILFSDHH